MVDVLGCSSRRTSSLRPTTSCGRERLCQETGHASQGARGETTIRFRGDWIRRIVPLGNVSVLGAVASGGQLRSKILVHQVESKEQENTSLPASHRKVSSLWK